MLWRDSPLRAVIPALALAILALLSVACGGGDDDVSSPAPTVEPGTINLTLTEPLATVTFATGDLQPGGPTSVAAGDFNGDGMPDLLLGANYADGPDGSRPDAGEAYVLFGPVSGDIDLETNAPDVTVFGAVAGDRLGEGVAVGDLNGDGIDDIIVGAPASNGLENLRTDMGEAYVVYGRADLPATVDTLAEEQDSGLLPAEGFSQLGRTFAVGDVNGDGVDDLVAGAPYAGREPDSPVGSPRTTVGEVYVVYGGASLRDQVSVARREQDVLISGSAEFDQFGGSVAVGDVNGDGELDIIIGADGYDPDDARGAAGGVFIYYGGEDLSRSLGIADADVVIEGGANGEMAGTLLATSDANGDGRVDLAVAATGGRGPGDELGAGRVYVVSGGLEATPSVMAPENFPTAYGAAAGEFLPGSLALSGNRLAAGAPARDEVYVLTVPAESAKLSRGAEGILTIIADGADGLGSAVAMADVDGDGSDDLIAQAAGHRDAPPAGFQGRVYVVSLGDYN